VNFVFYDTETAGLPRLWNAPVEHLANWPRVVQLGWVQTDQKGEIISEACRMVKPEGFRIPADAIARHGITNERASAEGLPVLEVLQEFFNLLSKTDVLIAHNADFDKHVLGAELLRANLENRLAMMPHICTMTEKAIMEHCGIPNLKYGGLKWPSLTELHRKLFGQAFGQAHDALADCHAVRKCYFRMRELSIVPEYTPKKARRISTRSQPPKG
jgi:DNA polymerase III epsilon subunit-like protein